MGPYNLQTTTESWFELSLTFLLHQKLFDGLEVGKVPVHLWHRLIGHRVADGKKLASARVPQHHKRAQIQLTILVWLAFCQMSRDVVREMPNLFPNKVIDHCCLRTFSGC